jgi:hypothetical protein
MNIPEGEIVKLWQKQLNRQDLADSEGVPIKVVYPGRPNDGRGADFRDAVVSTGGEIRKGCIEVHSRVSGWKAHGHHEDPVYNQVILHVAMEEDRPGRTVLQNGQSIPTVILDDSSAAPLRHPVGVPTTLVVGTNQCKVGDDGSGKCNRENEADRALQCQKNALKRDLVQTLKVLERLGQSRLAGKASRFMDEMSTWKL